LYRSDELEGQAEIDNGGVYHVSHYSIFVFRRGPRFFVGERAIGASATVLASRGYDNGHCIGHDEPSIEFISTKRQG
jgi:hypothetical protein